MVHRVLMHHRYALVASVCYTETKRKESRWSARSLLEYRTISLVDAALWVRRLSFFGQEELLMINRFARVARQTLAPDPLIPATAARRVATRLALLGFSVTPADITGQSISNVVRTVLGGNHRTSSMLVSQALRDELMRH
jgi:hypothetical protein